MPNDRSVSVSSLKPGTPQSFSFCDVRDTDCGFISTSTVVLKDIFTEKELEKVLNLCERKKNTSISNLAHCSVFSDSVLKNNIQTDEEGMQFNCSHN